MSAALGSGWRLDLVCPFAAGFYESCQLIRVLMSADACRLNHIVRVILRFCM